MLQTTWNSVSYRSRDITSYVSRDITQILLFLQEDMFAL